MLMAEKTIAVVALDPVISGEAGRVHVMTGVRCTV